MLLKSLKLKNIRSYDSINLEFREGSTLLSGDIGAGKSTILLAIEFALFGIIRGTISGSALLRHGCKDGSITLGFLIEGKDIEIQRSLKKGSNGITQDAGYIKIGSEKIDGTAVELKSKVLELLGYPEDLVSKSKTLIFRYTVYTPQEEMKQIIYESAEERLEKLRKIFDMDKYKRIKQNASNFARDLRSEIKASSNNLKPAENVREKLQEIEIENSLKKQELEKLEVDLVASKKKEEDLKKNMEEIQKQAKKLQDMKSEMQLMKQKVDSNKKLLENIDDELKLIDSEIEKKIDDELPKHRPIEEIEKDASEKQNVLTEIEEKISKAKNNLAVVDSKMRIAEKLSSEIQHLENCPTCKQEVTSEHKQKIESEEKKKIADLEEKKKKYATYLEKAEKILKVHKEGIEQLRKEKADVEIIEQKKKLIDREKKRLEELTEKKRNYELKKNKITDTQESLAKDIKYDEARLANIKFDEENLKKLSESYETAVKSTRSMEIKKAENTQILKSLAKEKESLQKELNEILEIKKRIEKTKMNENWMSKQFISVVDVIEKKFLGSIHKEFNQRFQEWFNILMDDEGLNAYLDEAFSPVIVQNGFENEIDNLSGGEKTSVALAYRLALNKVINDFMTTIKTRDIIILDEPTDGFSTEQLDKVRDVLEALNSKQTIIVSHEAKMESFVENVVRIRKHENLSGIY